MKCETAKQSGQSNKATEHGGGGGGGGYETGSNKLLLIPVYTSTLFSLVILSFLLFPFLFPHCMGGGGSMTPAHIRIPQVGGCTPNDVSAYGIRHRCVDMNWTILMSASCNGPRCNISFFREILVLQ